MGAKWPRFCLLCVEIRAVVSRLTVMDEHDSPGAGQ